MVSQRYVQPGYLQDGVVKGLLVGGGISMLFWIPILWVAMALA